MFENAGNSTCVREPAYCDFAFKLLLTFGYELRILQYFLVKFSTNKVNVCRNCFFLQTFDTNEIENIFVQKIVGKKCKFEFCTNDCICTIVLL